MNIFWRMKARGLVIGLIVDASISYAVAATLSSENSFWTLFGYCLAFLILCPIFFSIKGGMAQILFFLTVRGRLAEEFFIEIKGYELPTSGYSPFDADGYLAEVARSEDQPCEIRINATAMYARLSTQRQNGFIRGLFFTSAMDRAVRRHFAEN